MMDKSKLNFIDVATPKMGRVVYTNTYWICKNGDLETALFYGDSPQCNTNKSIVQNFADRKLWGDDCDLQIVFAPVSYVPNRN